MVPLCLLQFFDNLLGEEENIFLTVVFTNVQLKQCDQIWRNLAIWPTLGYFLLNLFFTLTNRFHTLFVVGILRFQMWFDVDVLNFQIKL